MKIATRAQAGSRLARCFAVSMTVLFFGCTSVSVKPVSDRASLGVVCIVENPKVLVGDFVPVVEQRFLHHGITTKLVTTDNDCTYTLTYTAERSWDLKPFLDYALLTLRKDGVSIGNAEYRNKGGFTFTKYADTETKINPVIDELLGASTP